MKNSLDMSTPTPEMSTLLAIHANGVSTPAEDTANTGFQGNQEEINVHPMSTLGVDMGSEFIGPKKAAEFLGIDQRSIKRNCTKGKYPGAKKAPIDGVEVWQIPVASLPIAAQTKLAEEAKAAIAARVGTLPAPKALPALVAGEYATLWEGFERSGPVFHRMAEAALMALNAFNELLDSGFTKVSTVTDLDVAMFMIDEGDWPRRTQSETPSGVDAGGVFALMD